MLKSIAFKLLVMLVCINLSSCYFLPTMNLSSSVAKLPANTKIKDIEVSIHPIDSDLIHELKESETAYSYQLGPYDQVNISVWGHPEFSSASGNPLSNNALSNDSITPMEALNGSYNLEGKNTSIVDYYPISGDGFIYFPLIGKQKLSGLTLPQASSLLEKKLAKYVVNPQVSLHVFNYRSRRVIVMGEVMQTKYITISDIPLTLGLALTMSGGVNISSANVQQIYVLRRKSRNAVNAYLLDLSQATAMINAEEFRLDSNDVIFVSTANISQFNRVMSQLLPAVETIWYARGSIPSDLFPALTN